MTEFYVCDHKRHDDTERRPNQCRKCGIALPPEEPPERIVRSRDWEELFLTGAAHKAGLEPGPWLNDVRDRMDRAQAQYGDSWATRPLRALVEEVDEEGMDLGGWSSLIGQRLYPAGYEGDTLELALDLLQRIAQLGAAERLLKLQLADVLGLDA